jgi:hypothetical protein
MAPLFTLLALAPLIAEYLLGSLSFKQMTLFPVMMVLYGGGAVFVRELTRRSGRGWPTILVLGVAYGLVEEAIATLSLFNPTYLGAHLLDRGYVPALGIAPPWTVYVLCIHAVWSIAVPVALVESLFPARRLTPWVGKLGLCVMGVVFAVGVTAVAVVSRRMNPFRPSAAEMGVSVLAIAAVTAAAFLLFRPAVHAPPPPPSPFTARGCRPRTMGLLAFLCGSAFHYMNYGSGSSVSTPAILAIELGLIAVVLAAVSGASRSPGWTAANNDAVATGALLVYCWWGFVLTTGMHGRSDIPGHCFPVAVVVFLLGVRHYRIAPRSAA